MKIKETFKEKINKERKKTPTLYKIPNTNQNQNEVICSEIIKKKNISCNFNSETAILERIASNLRKNMPNFTKITEKQREIHEKSDTNRNLTSTHSNFIAANYKNKLHETKNKEIELKNKQKKLLLNKNKQKDISDDEVICEDENIENIKPNNNQFNNNSKIVTNLQKIKKNIKKEFQQTSSTTLSSLITKKTDNKSQEKKNKENIQTTDRNLSDHDSKNLNKTTKTNDINKFKKNLQLQTKIKKPSNLSNEINTEKKYLEDCTNIKEDSQIIPEESSFLLECDELIKKNYNDKRKLKKNKKSKNQAEELIFKSDERNQCVIDSTSLNFLIKQEYIYTPDPFYLNNRNVSITWMMRAILFDWMMEVCSEFTLKRETFHLATNYIDRYLSKKYFIDKRKLQLIGLASMYIASKIEEIYAPKLNDFMRSANNAYMKEEIKDMELEILIDLKFMLHPPTINMWSNWYMSQWDLYIDQIYQSSIKPNFLKSININSIKYKLPNEESYILFREFMQILDNIVLDIQTLQYKSRTLIASLFYLIIGKKIKEFSLENIVFEFPFSSSYLINSEMKFNAFFSGYLNYCFGFDLLELLPAIQYLSTFFSLNMVNNLPTVAKLNKNFVLESHFEEFLAFQTHNSFNLDNIKKRNRNF